MTMEGDAKMLYKHKLLLDTLDKLEQGKYTGLDAHWCCKTIDWLWKWRKITEDELNSLCYRVIALMSGKEAADDFARELGKAPEVLSHQHKEYEVAV